MKNVKNNIILSAQDPGGFTALIPVINILKKNTDLTVVLAGESRKIARRHGIRYFDGANLRQADIGKLMEKFMPKILLTATSSGLSLEKKMIKSARTMGIAVLSFVDFWSNYKMRFSDPGTNNLSYLPDKICVIDSPMKREMVKQGFKSDIIIITGNPFFDSLNNVKVNDGGYILFASQPFSEIDKECRQPGRCLDEVRIFADYVRIFEKDKLSLPVIIAFHPREKNLKKFDQIIRNSKIKITVSHDDIYSLIRKASLVAGINSMVLFQASLLGKKVVSYQPGINRDQDPLISNKLGLSVGAYDLNELAGKISQILERKGRSKKSEKLGNRYLRNNSAQKFIKEVNKLFVC